MKLQLPVKLLVLLFTMGLFNACSVQKRHYTKGYYVSWKKQISSKALAQKVSISGNKTSQITGFRNAENNIESAKNGETFFASAQKSSTFASFPRKRNNSIFEGDSCADKIIYRNGDERLVKIFEVSDNEIAFRPCDYLDGPLYRISTHDVFMVKYATGTKRVFTTKVPSSASSSSPTSKAVKKKENGFAKASYIVSFFSLFYFIPAIVSIVFGIIALQQINNNPEKYNNKWKAVAGIAISSVFLFLLLLLIIFSV